MLNNPCKRQNKKYYYKKKITICLAHMSILGKWLKKIGDTSRSLSNFNRITSATVCKKIKNNACYFVQFGADPKIIVSKKNNLLQKLVSILGVVHKPCGPIFALFWPTSHCNQFYTHNVDHFTKFLNPPYRSTWFMNDPLAVAFQYEFFKSYTGFIVLHMNVNIYFSHDFCK